ncbi:MAG: hypothetical protein ACOCQD_02615 [archaeon]
MNKKQLQKRIKKYKEQLKLSTKLRKELSQRLNETEKNIFSLNCRIDECENLMEELKEDGKKRKE